MVKFTGKKTLFFDTITNKVDAKARVSVPASYRSVIESQGSELIAFRSFSSPCIECCTSELMEKIASDIENGLDMFSEAQDDLTSLIYADAKEFVFDSTGRIGLTDKLLKHAGITDTAVFVGKGRTFQIWNPEAYAKEEQEIRKRAIAKRPVLASSAPKDKGK